MSIDSYLDKFCDIYEEDELKRVAGLIRQLVDQLHDEAYNIGLDAGVLHAAKIWKEKLEGIIHEYENDTQQKRM